MSASIKLIYFDSWVAPRLVLIAAGQKYEDVPTPYGQLPVLVYNGKAYGQNMAIAAFLAKEFGMYGKTNKDALRIDEVTGLVADLDPWLAKARFESDPEKKSEALKKCVEEQIPKFLGLFEKLLQENGSNGYFVGNSLTLADLVVFNVTDTITKLKSDAAISAYPAVQKLRQTLSEHPNIKAQLASREETPF
nr:hypothetical protein BaRGS_028130 [Batillaria attramentaria]